MKPEISSLKTAIQSLVIIKPTEGVLDVVNKAQIDAFAVEKAALTAPLAALPVKTDEEFAIAGEAIDGLATLVEMLDERFEKPTVEANQRHKALTGTRRLMAGDLEDLAKSLRNKRAVYKAAKDAEAARVAAAEQARLRAEAEAKRQEGLRLAREAEAERQRVAAEAAAEAERVRVAAAAEAERIRLEAEAAAAEIEDPDAAMEAAAAAEEAAAEAERVRVAAEAEAARVAEEAEAAAQAAAAALAAAEAAPVVVERVAVAVAVPAEDNVSWADNWVAEYDEVEALRAIVAAGALEYLTLNVKAINAAAKSQKSLAKIPGVVVVNRKQERRR